jgi:acyl-CoA hydrolase
MPERTHEITLRFLAGLPDINIYGKVHGGAVMKWIDEAGYACAAGWCRQPAVTVYVGGIQFHKPVPVGSLVEVHARLIYTGNTSMHIAVNVCAGDPTQGEFTHTTQCIIVYVAIDSDGKPTAVPKWRPATAEDVALENYARKLMELRQTIEGEIQRASPTPEG